MALSFILHYTFLGFFHNGTLCIPLQANSVDDASRHIRYNRKFEMWVCVSLCALVSAA